jgi:hypothetical protein
VDRSGIAVRAIVSPCFRNAQNEERPGMVNGSLIGSEAEAGVPSREGRVGR